MKIIKFGAVWCSNCLVMKPRWAEIEKELPWLKSEYYDFDEDKEMVEKYGIDEKLPVFIFIDKEGNEFDRKYGDISTKDLIELPEFTARDLFQGAGFIKSSLNDMFKYLEAQMGLTETNLQDAIAYCHQPQFELNYWGQQCFGWYKKEIDDGQQIIYCGGNTIGFGSYIGFNETLKTGVILWYNADYDDGANLYLGPKILEAINKY